jgi:hypothetical protein
MIKKVQVLWKYCYLYFTWELISAYTVCDFDKNVLVFSVLLWSFNEIVFLFKES